MGVADRHDTLEERNGRPACAKCGGLLAIAYKPRRKTSSGNVGEIAAKMGPDPAPGIERVLCASCATILWEDG